MEAVVLCDAVMIMKGASDSTATIDILPVPDNFRSVNSVSDVLFPDQFLNNLVTQMKARVQ
jgi:hypothetical protein